MGPWEIMREYEQRETGLHGNMHNQQHHHVYALYEASFLLHTGLRSNPRSDAGGGGKNHHLTTDMRHAHKHQKI